MAADDPTSLFVYGTLLPGDVRWPLLRPFVTDDGRPDQVEGRLYDSGLDYPAAVFDDRTIDGDRPDDADASPARVVLGRVFEIEPSVRARCLEVLDEEEGTVGGLYRRIVVTTDSGTRSWAYEYGEGLALTRIADGDWTNVDRGS